MIASLFPIAELIPRFGFGGLVATVARHEGKLKGWVYPMTYSRLTITCKAKPEEDLSFVGGLVFKIKVKCVTE